MRRLTWTLGVLLCWSTLARAQGLPVYDNANFLQNIVTAAQTTITALQSVLIEANQILELTPLDDLAVEGGIAEDMAMLGQLLAQAEGLSYDINSLETQINALFDLETAPDTRDGLDARLAEMKQLKFQSYRYAARVQTLLMTADRTIQHMVDLLNTVKGLLGNMQANQTASQFHSVSAKHLANLDVQQASFQRAQTVDKLSDALIIESLHKISIIRLEDHPRY
jgi:conjugal transfer/entry exclusion protein